MSVFLNLSLPYMLRQGLPLNPDLDEVASQLACLLQECEINLVAEGMDSGPHACVAVFSLAEPSLQRQCQCFLTKNTHYFSRETPMLSSVGMAKEHGISTIN